MECFSLGFIRIRRLIFKVYNMPCTCWAQVAPITAKGLGLGLGLRSRATHSSWEPLLCGLILYSYGLSYCQGTEIMRVPVMIVLHALLKFFQTLRYCVSVGYLISNPDRKV